MRQRDIIAASVVPSLLLISIMAVVARLLWTQNRAAKDQPDTGSGGFVEPNTQQTSLLSRARSVRLFSAPNRERGHWVPTFSGMIKAADEAVFSSLLLNGHHGPPGEISLEHVYEGFANELRSRPVAEISAYPQEVTKFLLSTKRLQRAQSVSTSPPHKRPDVPERRSRKSVGMIRNSIELAEMGLNRSRSSKKTASLNLVSVLNVVPSEAGVTVPTHTYWGQDLQHVVTFEGHKAVPVTAHELAALSVILGSPIDFGLGTQDKDRDSWATTYKGAVGVSISVKATKDGAYHVSLSSTKRHISQLPAKGSGYSISHAKHLASGSLPFTSERKAVNSIIITSDTLENLKAGAKLHLQRAGADTKGVQFLASLPNSRTPHFHTFAPSTNANSASLLVHAIGDLPFTGGFTPFASAPLIKTVQFVASGGLDPGRLLQRLDALVEKVHHQAPHLQLFGPFLEPSNAHLRFRANERLAKLATGTMTEEALADKVARMHRYTTLLERLMALVPDMKPTDVLPVVRSAMKSEMERAYDDAVAAHAINTSILPSSSTATDAVPQRGTKRSRRSMISSGSTSPELESVTSGRSSATFPMRNLGRRVEHVLKGGLPLDVPTIAMVARLVLVAWTLSVESVAWEEGEVGFRVGHVETMPERMYAW